MKTISYIDPYGEREILSLDRVRKITIDTSFVNATRRIKIMVKYDDGFSEFIACGEGEKGEARAQSIMDKIQKVLLTNDVNE